MLRLMKYLQTFFLRSFGYCRFSFRPMPTWPTVFVEIVISASSRRVENAIPQAIGIGNEPLTLFSALMIKPGFKDYTLVDQTLPITVII